MIKNLIMIKHFLLFIIVIIILLNLDCIILQRSQKLLALLYSCPCHFLILFILLISFLFHFYLY